MDWGKPYRETRFDGKVFQVRKTRCTCSCHIPGNAIMHFMACCESGWIYQKKIVQPLGIRKLALQLIVPKSYHENMKKYSDISFIQVK